MQKTPLNTFLAPSSKAREAQLIRNNRSIRLRSHSVKKIFQVAPRRTRNVTPLVEHCVSRRRRSSRSSPRRSLRRTHLLLPFLCRPVYPFHARASDSGRHMCVRDLTYEFRFVEGIGLLALPSYSRFTRGSKEEGEIRR